ncbi:hypothetical protein [Herbidospora mongoliensis]|nr:hypothetical protein [Herbidospora mongoliensis]
MVSLVRAGRGRSTGSLRIGAPAGTVTADAPEKVRTRSLPVP